MAAATISCRLMEHVLGPGTYRSDADWNRALLAAMSLAVELNFEGVGIMTQRRMLVPAALALALGLAGCETLADAVKQGMTASLTGAQEVPGPGDVDGSGTAEITIVDATDNVCFDLRVRNIAPATAAHLHRGRRGEAGPPVVTLQAPSDGSAKGCVNVPGALADEIEANPVAFYVNIHNAEFPDGAIRGQLAR